MDKQQDNTLAWVSYITIIGWIIALVMSNNSGSNSVVKYHLRQALGIYLFVFAGSLIAVIPILGWIIWFVVSIAGLVFWIMGLISAVQGEEKPVPMLGEPFQKWFTFIK